MKGLSRAVWRLAVALWATLKDYVGRVFEKAEDDNIFVLASGLTFSVLVAAVPLLFIIVSLLSTILQVTAQSAGVEPVEQLREYLLILVPVLDEGSSGTGPNLPEEIIDRTIRQGEAVGVISFIAFVWFSTRLFGAVRAVLREVFDLRQSRGVIRGKLFDMQMVLVASILVILNIGITIVLNLAKARGIEFLGLSPDHIGIVERLYAQITALAFIFLLFLLLYKYVPAGRIPWRMALTAAAFTAICWELLKWGFALYLTRVADYNSIYGGIATLVVVVFWLYNLSIVFILGAQVAQIHEMRRVRVQQIEVLE
jgi:membrane protein